MAVVCKFSCRRPVPAVFFQRYLFGRSRLPIFVHFPQKQFRIGLVSTLWRCCGVPLARTLIRCPLTHPFFRKPCDTILGFRQVCLPCDGPSCNILRRVCVENNISLPSDILNNIPPLDLECAGIGPLHFISCPSHALIQISRYGGTPQLSRFNHCVIHYFPTVDRSAETRHDG